MAAKVPDMTVAASRVTTVPARVPLRHVLVVTSPKAGSGLGREEIPRLVSLLGQRSLPVHVTPSITDVRPWLQEHSSGQPDASLAVVAAGGDGTLALVAEHLPPTVPIVPMPLGTENLLATHYGYSAIAERVLETILTGRPISIDAGQANGRLFLVVASAGFDAEVVRGMHLTRRGHIRRAHYLIPLLRAAMRYQFPEIEVRVDGHLCSGLPPRWAMVFNLPCYAARLPIEPDACGDDGLLDLIGFSRGSIASGFWYTGGVILGRHRNWPDVLRRRGCRIELSSSQRVPYQLDGDYVGRLPLVLETLPARVRLLLPT